MQKSVKNYNVGIRYTHKLQKANNLSQLLELNIGIIVKIRGYYARRCGDIRVIDLFRGSL
jgi:hypothetical protein